MTLKPSLMVLLVCAVGAAGDLHALPHVSALDGARSRVAELRADLDGRWRCDTATRRALVTDGDAERLLGDVAGRVPGGRRSGHALTAPRGFSMEPDGVAWIDVHSGRQSRPPPRGRLKRVAKHARFVNQGARDSRSSERRAVRRLPPLGDLAARCRER